MGAWGVKLYQDDVACDVKNEYIFKLKVGLSNEVITQNMINNYLGSEDEIIFWLALADTQWRYGRLREEVKENAIKIIDSGMDLERWKENIDLLEKRKRILFELKSQLLEQPQALKRVSKLSPYLSPFKKGDLLLYQIKDEKFKNHKWYHKFVLFRVIAIDVQCYYDIPNDRFCSENLVISLYNFIGDEKSIPDVTKLKFIKVSLRNDDRFATICFNNRDFKKASFSVLSNDTSISESDVEKKYSDGISFGIALLNIYNFESYLIAEMEKNEDMLIQI